MKLELLRATIERLDLDGCLLSRQGTVSWLCAGLADRVVRGADPGLIRILVTNDVAYLLTQNIEAARLVAEDPPADLGLELVELPWHGETPEQKVIRMVASERLGTDGFGPGRPIEEELRALRLALLPVEHERLRDLGREATEALEAALRELRPGDTERETAAAIAAGLERRDIFPQVLLVGGDERRRRFRHPVPSGSAIKRDALGVVCGERGGLFVALSRSVSIGRPEAALAERHRLAAQIEAELIVATRPGPGKTYQSVLDLAPIAYNRHGYPDEWQKHHQGGPIGYAAREQVVSPSLVRVGGWPLPVRTGGACAWNPSILGAKSEDTFLVGRSGNEVITTGADWPQIQCLVDAQPVERPGILTLD